MSFQDWVQTWIVTYKEPFVGHYCMDSIQSCLKHILNEFGNQSIDDINGVQIQKFLLSLSDTPNMQDKCRKYLTDIFKFAYRNRIISWDPMCAIKFKPYRFDNTPVMNADDRKIFVDSLSGKSYEVLYLTYLYTGARRAELVTPGEFEVDFDNGFCFIHGTKTVLSDRVVPLFDVLCHHLMLLEDYKKYFESYSPNWVYLCFHRHMKKIGMPQYCVRSLRCTFSLMCYELGVRDTTISAWLGHSAPRTTNTFYLNNTAIALSQLSAVQHEIDLVNRSIL